MSETTHTNSGCSAKNTDDLSCLSYADQLNRKTQSFQQLIEAFYTGDIDVFESDASGYRMRCEFRIWHEGDELSYAMFTPGTKSLYSINEFPPANTHIQNLMPLLLGKIRKTQALKHRLFSIEFLSTQAGEILVTLIYHRPLDNKWEAEADRLHRELNIAIIGRSRKQKLVLTQDFVTERFTVGDLDYQYRQYENSFTQPNAQINQQMLDWVCAQTPKNDKDLLELYCGNGNFTLPLSKLFRKVLTTEVSKRSIAALKWNIDTNKINNIDQARLSAEEITEALDGVRPFRRLAHLDLNSYEFGTVFVDPPRAGVDEKTLELLTRFENIIYVSCNPMTLADNLQSLDKTHRVVAAAAFDQFPFTQHLETAVCLKKING